MAQKRAESVERWVMVDNNGQYAIDLYGSQFTEELAEAYIFVSRPVENIALRWVSVTVTLKH